MKLFFELEAAYIVIGIFILAVTAFVTTRPFVGRNAFKIGFPGVFLILTFFIIAHYVVTTNRMNDVETRFIDHKPVICENRVQRKVNPSVIISQAQGWSLNEHIFTNPQYNRGFHTARCLELFNEEYPD
ncbi:hypothetical protein [Candidatus Marinarcus aquaticus]|uniref:Uncharacterized protein n=1 Tax=Candidatus Marinarcus aquaticus TaxID=2044504 RepID=A0A4V1LNY2_9BACT|nr:hypothetical protein [Candidatus Marinarcus aquaticus]RXJ57610.1 hypothetical protein CRV04_07305 [Candidatus Marinarcus aquaticus]